MPYTVYETFVGAGGSHLGFKNNGYISKYVNDFSDEALETLTNNNPEILETAWVDNTSIVDVVPAEILRRTEMVAGELDVLFGGIVCKGFSLAGERSPNDERNYFYRKQLEIVQTILPKISIIENVPGIQNAEVLAPNAPIAIANEIDEIWQALENYKGQKADRRKKGTITAEFEEEGKELRKKKEDILKRLKNNGYLISVIDDIEKRYTALGYKVDRRVLNSACYGAATKRERVIIVAVRKDVVMQVYNLNSEEEYKQFDFRFDYPRALYGNDAFRKKYPYLYEGVDEVLPLRTVNDALATIDYNDEEDVDNIPMNHDEKTVRRFRYIPEGDNIANHIDELPDDLKISRFYSRGNTMRLNGNEPSPTLVPGHSNFPIHPREHRSITVREAATITGFPNDYVFVGNHTKRCEEVGNAVPPALSTAVARKASDLLNLYYGVDNNE